MLALKKSAISLPIDAEMEADGAVEVEMKDERMELNEPNK